MGTKRFKIASVIFVSSFIFFLMLAGLSYGFYQNRYLENHNKNLSKHEVATENINTRVETKPEEIKPIVDTGTVNPGKKIDTSKTAKKSTAPKTNTQKTVPTKKVSRISAAEELVAIEFVKTLKPYPKVNQYQYLIDQDQKIIDDDNAKIAESNIKIAQYEQEIVGIQALMGAEGNSPEEFHAYNEQIKNLRSLISNEWVQIDKLMAEIAIHNKLIEQEKQK